MAVAGRIERARPSTASEQPSVRFGQLVAESHPYGLPEPRTPRVPDRQHRTTGREIGSYGLLPSTSRVTLLKGE
jgi:hypothetical protein